MSTIEAPRSEAKPRPEDVATPDAIIKAMYDTISGPAGKRNWQRERSLFLPGARLIPIGKRVHGEGGLRVMTLDEWIEDVKPFFEENDFWETEIVRHNDRFGNMIQAFSTYEARNSREGPPIVPRNQTQARAGARLKGSTRGRAGIPPVSGCPCSRCPTSR